MTLARNLANRCGMAGRDVTALRIFPDRQSVFLEQAPACQHRVSLTFWRMLKILAIRSTARRVDAPGRQPPLAAAQGQYVAKYVCAARACALAKRHRSSARGPRCARTASNGRCEMALQLELRNSFIARRGIA